MSGINHGPTLGDDVTYSGTVAAAMEGRCSAPAIAVSQQSESREMDSASAPTSTSRSPGASPRVVEELEDVSLPPSTLSNINVPAGTPNGVEVARLGKRIYRDRLQEQEGDGGDRAAHVLHLWR